jgi:hypothetical protein
MKVQTNENVQWWWVESCIVQNKSNMVASFSSEPFFKIIYVFPLLGSMFLWNLFVDEKQHSE